MAISAEQAAAISTAIENLNKSVQVNEEILEIIKSMQATGAAGTVAEHNNDLNAHQQFRNVHAHKGIFLTKEGTTTETWIKSPYAFMVRAKDGGSTEASGQFIELWGTHKSSAEQNSQNLRIQFYQRNPDNSNVLGASVIGAIQSRFYYEDPMGTGKNDLRNGMYFTVQSGGKSATYFELNDAGGVREASYWMYGSNFHVQKEGGCDLGNASNQWKDLYLKNSPTVSSDRRLKQEFSAVPEAVFKAWEKVNFCQYKFKEAVEKKGAEARLHVGLVAQEILEAFEAQGLDATKYGIVCHDSWEDQYQDVEVGTKPAVLNEKGEVVKPEEPIMEHQLVKPAGDLWTVRYEEALALEAAYQRWKLQKIEAALAEKGISL